MLRATWRAMPTFWIFYQQPGGRVTRICLTSRWCWSSAFPGSQICRWLHWACRGQPWSCSRLTWLEIP